MTKLKRLALVLLAASSLFLVACGSTPKDDSKNSGGAGSSSQSRTGSGIAGDGSDSGSGYGSGNSLTDDDGSGSGRNGYGDDDDGSGDDGSGSGSGSGYGYDDDEDEEFDENTAKNYNALFRMIEKSREKAIDAGAEYDDATSDFFSALDEEYRRQRELAESEGISPEMTNILRQINAAYEGLAQYEEAKAKKKLIDDNDYASNNQRAYDEGADLLEQLEEIMADSDSFFEELRSGDSDVGTQFLNKATRANTDFTNVLKASANNMRTEAFKAKKQADSVKASVSRKDDYDDGVSEFRAGDSNYVTGSIDESIENYTKARDIFATLYKEVAAARAEAQKKISEAKKKVNHAWGVADEADKTDPLTEKIDGIEDHDAKLLEDDDFTDAENSYVEIDEELDDDGGDL
ncbi:MAG: hypothetical protein IJR93_09095 [Treponema sp.]|nr:hypothetical protein [Treponema sp.]MBQ7167083.1 hypothetical protein [Treponema sp.]